MARVEFTKTGWRQFIKMNQSLGSRFIKGFLLRFEVAAYLTHHIENGAVLDSGCQELRYESGIYLLMKQVQGEWLITDIWTEDEPVDFSPVYFWTRVKRGCSYVLRQILIGWQQLTWSPESEVLT